METESGIRNMTVGSPFRHILMFTLPLLAGNFLQQFYNMVDSWVVGNFVSDGALAAVGVGFPVIFLFTSLFSGIATGGTVVIAQAFGGGRPGRVRSAIDSLYTAFIRSILPITAAALLLVHPLMTVLRVDPAAWAETRTYLLVVCAGLVGSIGYNLNAGILGGMGNSSTTLLFLAVSTILNIFLDLALVLAVPLGVLGVALGTVIAQLCSWLFGIWYINRRYPQLAIHPIDSWSKYRGVADMERVEAARAILLRSNEINQMMKVIGEEGTSDEDYILYQKGELLDAVYLQQNSFDPIDAACSPERQLHEFNVLYDVLTRTFALEDKKDIRAFFNQLRQEFLDWHNTRFQTPEFEAQEQKLKDFYLHRAAV